MDEVQHTDARELAAFEALGVDAKLREIWLNGRETNGKVAEAMRDIAAIQPVVQRHDFWFRVAAVAVAALVAIGPAVFWLIDHGLHGR